MTMGFGPTDTRNQNRRRKASSLPFLVDADDGCGDAARLVAAAPAMGTVP